MTKVTITAEQPDSPDTLFRASAMEIESVGPTPGAALDALTARLGNANVGTLIVVQNLHGDEFFSEAQQHRLRELLDQWRAVRERGETLSLEARAELEALVDSELDGSARRAAAMVSVGFS